MNQIKIGFILCSSSANPIPSTRIAVLNMLSFLHSASFKTCIIFEPLEPTETPDLTGVFKRVVEENCNVVVFQKVSGRSAVELAKKISEIGVRSIFSVCDRVDLQMACATDFTIVISDFLKSLYPKNLQSRIYVVHDGIENPSIVKNDWGRHSSPIKALLVTSHDLDYLPVINSTPSWLDVKIMGRYQSGFNRLPAIYFNFRTKTIINQLRYLNFLINGRISCIPWGAKEVYRELVNADVGIIPISFPATKSSDQLPSELLRKSENRLTLKMSVGLPVIATPIPAYETVIDQGRNGFLARSPQDWNKFLNALRDPDLRQKIGLAARKSVEKKYSMQEQASRLIGVINRLS